MKNLTTNLWLRTGAVSKKTGLTSIYCRIFYSKKDEIDVNTEFKILPEHWDNRTRQVVDTGRAAEYNRGLARLVEQIMAIDSRLIDLGQERSAEIIRNILLNKGETRKWTLLDIINEHNERYQVSLNNNVEGHSADTFVKYNRLYVVTKEFIKAQYNRSDIFLTELNYNFIETYTFWLKTVKKLKTESIRSSYFGKLNKIINFAVKKGRIKQYPFEDFTIKRNYEIDDSNWLTLDEVLKIQKHKFKNERLEKVRIRTLVSLFTGLSYSDMETLNLSHIKIDINNTRFIQKKRGKTGKEAIVPIFPDLADVLDPYISTASARKGRILPSLSNRNYNNYLREMLDLIGIEKELTGHKLRHSFAQICLEAGFSLEAISKMLGHSNTRTATMHYIKFNKKLVLSNQDLLQESINKRKKTNQTQVIELSRTGAS